MDNHTPLPQTPSNKFSLLRGDSIAGYAKALVWLVVAVELAVVGYIGYGLLPKPQENPNSNTVIQKDDGAECLIQIINGEAFKICSQQ